MSALEGFDATIRDEILSLSLNESTLATLAEELDLRGGSDAESLVVAAIEAHKGPNLLMELARLVPDRPEPGDLLAQWESDANLQDDWAETASARDLQRAKAWYVRADRSGEGDPKRLGRLLRKISRALADHPDNASGEYEIYGPVRAITLLGNGEVATVYKGAHLETGETVAVKVLKPSAAANDELVDVLIRATERLSELRHPQIARVRQPVRPDDRPRSRPFFVMDYADAGTLEDRIADADFGRRQRQRAALRLCQGLAYAHQRGLVHGNLKPSNVLLGSPDATRLSDFLVTPGAESSAVEVIKRMGAPYYTGPEVVSGQAPSVRSDIFSLGRLLFRLFTSKEENLYEVMVPQLFKQELDDQLSDYPDLTVVIERCTALEPAERPASVAEVLAELHRFGGRLGVDREAGMAELRANGDWTSLIEAQQTSLLSLEAEQQVAALEDVASVQEYVLGDAQGALESWAQAFRTAPGSSATIEAELDRLRSDLETPEAARVEAEAITAVLDWGRVDDDDELLRLKLKAARLFHDEVEDNPAAIPLYLDALEIEPTNETAYAALDVLYQTEGDWPGLVALLERRLETRDDADEREGLLQRMARVQEDRVDDLEAAAETWLRLRNLAPASETAFTNLDRLYRSLSRWDDLAALLEGEIQRVEGGDAPARQAIELRYALAQVLETHLSRPAEAVDLYRTILEGLEGVEGEAGDPDHGQSILALEGLMAAGTEALAAARLLEPIYRRRDQPSNLAGALEVLVRDIAADDDRWVTTLEEIAAIRERHEGDLDAAFDVYARLHRGRPELTRVWDELERLAPRGSNPRWDETAELYRGTVGTATAGPEPVDADFVVALWQRVGEVEIQHRYDFEAAIGAYRAILELAPNHEGALRKLELLYDETERWLQLIEVLDTQKAIRFEADDKAEGVALMHRMAALYEEQLGDADRGIQTYAAALAIDAADDVSVAQLERLSHDPAHTAKVVELLDPHYTGLKDWASLLSLLERGLERVPDRPAAERADTLLRLARVAESEQSDQAAAFEYLIRAVREDVDRDSAHAELERVAAAIGAWERAVSFYTELLSEDQAASLSDDRHQAMRFRMAVWQRDQLERLDDAEESFRAVLAINPDHKAALDALDELHTRRHQYPQLYEVLARKAELAPDPDAAKRVLFRMAHLCDEQLNDLDRAIQAYDQIVQIGQIGQMGAVGEGEAEPAPDPAALDGLADIYERQGDHARLLDTLRQRAAVEPDAGGRIVLLRRMGELARGQLDDAVTALDAFEQALDLEPADPRPVLEALAELYLAGHDLASWYRILPARLEHARSDAERVARHLQAAELATRPDAPEQVEPTGHYESALRSEPYRPDVLMALESIYSRQERWADLDDVYRRQFIGIHLKAAELAAEQMGDRDKAIEHLRRALELDPDRVPIIDRLRQHFEAAGAWDEVVALVERKLALLDDPAQKGALLASLAQALERNGERARAIDATHGALELEPGNLDALARLGRLVVLEDRVAELLPDAVERAREASSSARLGPVLQGLDLLVNTSQALADGDEKAARASVVEALGVADLEADVAIGMMQPLFESRGASEIMREALSQVVEKRPRRKGRDAERRRAVFRAAAQLSEADGDPEAAYELYGRYVAEQPAQAEARRELLRLGGELDRAEEAIERIEQRLEAGIDEPEQTVEISLQLGHVLEDGDAIPRQPDRAIGHFRRVLEVQPEQPEALEALDRLYGSIELWPALRQVLERRVAIAEVGGSTEEHVELSLRLASLIERAFDEPAAVADLAIGVLEASRQSAELREARGTARGMLESLAEQHAEPGDDLFFRLASVLEIEYGQTKRRDALIELLEREVALLPDDAPTPRRYDRLVALARAAADAGEHARALARAGEAARLRPGDPDLFELLEELTERVSDWEGLVTLYLELLAREELNVDQALQLSLKAAFWLEEKLDHPENAADAYAYALQLDETQPAAQAALERLYIELGRMDDLYDLLLLRAEQAESDERRGLLERAANLAHEELGRAPAAIECYRRILEENGPDGELLDRLRELYEEVADYEALYEIMTAQLVYVESEGADPEEAAALRLALGVLAWEHLGDGDRAVPNLSGALVDETTHDQALALLATIYEATGQWAELVDRLQSQVPLARSPEVKLELSLRGARVAEEQLADVSAAVALYEEVREVAPDHHEATEALFRLLEQTGQWAELLANLETDLGRVQDEGTQVALALRIADLARTPDKLGDSTLAAHYLGVALEIEPANLEATRMLVDLHLAEERPQDAVAVIGWVLGEVAGGGPDATATRVELLLLRGDIFLDHLDLEESAARDFNEAFQLDPTSADAADRLARLLTQQQAWNDLLSLYAKLVDRLDDVAAKVEVALKVSDLVAQYDLAREPLIEVLEKTLAGQPPYPLDIQLILKLIAAYQDVGNLPAASAYVEEGLQNPNGASNRAFQAELFHYKGLIARSQGDSATALEAHEACYQLDNGHVPNLIALSRLLYGAERWDDAVRILQVALLKQAALSTEQKVEVYHMMGMAWVYKGDRRRARDMFNRVLGLDREHSATLEALDELG